MADFTAPDANGVSVPVATPAHEAGQVLKQNFTALSAALTDKASLSAGGTFAAPIEVPAGAAGNQVPNLAQVKQLVAGTAGLMARFDFSTTVGGTPGAGELRLNNATQISATEMRLSGMSNDGLDLANFMLQMGAGYTIYLQESGNSANFQKWTMTSDPVVSGGYATFGVSLYSSSGTGTTGFADGLDLIVWGLSEVVPSDTDALPEGSTNKYFTEARVLATVLAGLSLVTGTAITAADSVLSAFGKVQKQITDAIASIALKADIASPALTGTPTAPTATAGTNTTQIATTAFVTTAVAAGAGVPVGTIITVAGSTAPTGTLKANGAAYSRTTYADLFDYLVTDEGYTSTNFTITIASPGVVTKTAHGFTGNERLRLSTTGALPTGLNTTTDYFVEKINNDTFYLLSTPSGTRVNTSGSQSGTHSFLRSTWGLGDGSTTFNVPDLRGDFLRGWDDGRGVDTGRAFGTWQKDALQTHIHSFTRSTWTGGGGDSWASGTNATQANSNTSEPTNASIAAETRPRNAAILVCIKY